MVPAGYLAKRVLTRPDWLKAPLVDDIYSVSECMSKPFADYDAYWKHNGYWLFSSIDAIRSLAAEESINLDGCKFFYYEVYEQEYDEESGQWQPIEPEREF